MMQVLDTITVQGVLMLAFNVWPDLLQSLVEFVLAQVELEIMLPEDMSVKESHDIALMLQHKVTFCTCSNLVFIMV